MKRKLLSNPNRLQQVLEWPYFKFETWLSLDCLVSILALCKDASTWNGLPSRRSLVLTKNTVTCLPKWTLCANDRIALTNLSQLAGTMNVILELDYWKQERTRRVWTIKEIVVLAPKVIYIPKVYDFLCAITITNAQGVIWPPGFDWAWHASSARVIAGPNPKIMELSHRVTSLRRWERLAPQIEFIPPTCHLQVVWRWQAPNGELGEAYKRLAKRRGLGVLEIMLPCWSNPVQWLGTLSPFAHSETKLQLHTIIDNMFENWKELERELLRLAWIPKANWFVQHAAKVGKSNFATHKDLLVQIGACTHVTSISVDLSRWEYGSLFSWAQFERQHPGRYKSNSGKIWHRFSLLFDEFDEMAKRHSRSVLRMDGTKISLFGLSEWEMTEMKKYHTVTWFSRKEAEIVLQ